MNHISLPVDAGEVDPSVGVAEEPVGERPPVSLALALTYVDAEAEEVCKALYTNPENPKIIHLDDNACEWSAFTERVGGQLVAFGLGQADARDNLGCVPENYFAGRALKEYYCRGYASVAGHNLTTRYFLHKELFDGYIKSVP